MKKLSSLFGSHVRQDRPAELFNKLTRSQPGPPAFMFPPSLEQNEDVEDGMDVIRLDNHFDDQLPNPEELKTHALVPPTPMMRQKRFKWACVGLVCFTILIVLITTLPQKKDSGVSIKDTVNAVDAVDAVEVQTLSVSHSSSLKDTISFLLKDVDHQKLTNTSSPQFLAAEWLADEDSRSAPLNSEFRERYALTVLWFATGGGTWSDSANFMTAVHHCDWRATFQRDDLSVFEMGVECNENADVQSIVLQTLGLKGGLPSELTMLSGLEKLYLDRNELTDFESIRPLKQVKNLSLTQNKFATDLPGWLEELSELQILGLSSNGFTSSLPNELEGMLNLKTLALDDNDLSGDLSVIDKMPWLEKVYLEDNMFTGTLTNEFFKYHRDLEVLDLSSNKLEGSLSGALLQLPKLQILDLHNNYLGGNIPEIQDSPSPLQFLALNQNFFDGPIPTSISRFSSIKHLDLSANRLSGDIPASNLNQLTTMEYLFLSFNDLLTPGPIPELRALTNLQELSLKGTARSGEIPSWIANLNQLILLDLHHNRLNSTIPKQLSELSNLSFLLVNRNELEGTVPVELSKLESLSLLLVDQNDLIGDVDSLCPLELHVMIADCKEVECDCCTKCCDDANDECQDTGWLANYEPNWQNRYTRDVFDFGHDVVFVPVNVV